MNVGDRIRQFRIGSGLSQEQMANMFHVTRQTISNWENGRTYPDLSILIKICEMSDMSLDELLREDTDFVKENDEIRKKALFRIRCIRGIVCALVIVIAAFVGLMIYTGKGTDNGKRIMTDTVVRMSVNLQEQTPSRAITRTYEADDFDAFSEDKAQSIKYSTLGKLEGDIPCIYLESREKSKVEFAFQDNDYNNIQPQIISVKMQTNADDEAIEVAAADYVYDNGKLTVYITDIISQNGSVREDSADPGADEVQNCIFEIRYSDDYYKREFVSVTAVNIFYNDEINW